MAPCAIVLKNLSGPLREASRPEGLGVPENSLGQEQNDVKEDIRQLQRLDRVRQDIDTSIDVHVLEISGSIVADIKYGQKSKHMVAAAVLTKDSLLIRAFATVGYQPAKLTRSSVRY